MLEKEEIRNRVRELGADLCGFAPLERFHDAPAGFHPRDVMAGCGTVIVVAARFPVTTLQGNSKAAYTFVRHRMVGKLDSITFQLASELEEKGMAAVPVPSAAPYEYWDEERRHGQGILSLKHSAVRAGLGFMGKNTLFISPEWGNMTWLGAVLAEEKYEGDPLPEGEGCPEGCRICLEACPMGALTGTTIIQKACRSHMGRYSDGGEGVIVCKTCRAVCPRCLGSRNKGIGQG